MILKFLIFLYTSQILIAEYTVNQLLCMDYISSKKSIWFLSLCYSLYSDTQSNGSSVVEPSRAMPSNDAANGENHPPISRTNQNAHQTFTGHRATHSVSTANNNIGHQPSTQYDDDVDDDFDAAVMNVDLDMFENNIDLDMLDDDFGQESHANQEGENHHVTTPSNNVSTHSSSVEMKGISEILSVVKDNTFCGTLHTKVL